MSTIHPWFAQETLPLDIVSAPWQKMDAATRKILIILGAVAVVTLLATTWVLASRQRRRRSKHHSHRHHSHHNHSANHPPSEQHSVSASAVDEDEDEDSSESKSGRRRRRRRRREHRPRNPTLAETGGLPPLRPPHDSYP